MILSAPSLPCTHYCVRAAALVPESLLANDNKQSQQLCVSTRVYYSRSRLQTAYAIIRASKGFGPPPPPAPKKKEEAVVRRAETKAESSSSSSSNNISALQRRRKQEEKEEQHDDDGDDDMVPEVVSNRMLRRIAFTVGIPFALGIVVFPVIYYLKVIQKLDVPEWLPVLTSMVTFGSTSVGIAYGVLSTSWDPLREGSLLGWREAQLNWPAFWQNLEEDKEGPN